MKKNILIVSSSGLITDKIEQIKKSYPNVNIIQCDDNISSIENNMNNINVLINCPRKIFSKNFFL